MRSLAWKSGILIVLDLGSVADGTAKRKTIYTEGHEAHKEMNTGGQSIAQKATKDTKTDQELVFVTNSGTFLYCSNRFLTSVILCDLCDLLFKRFLVFPCFATCPDSNRHR
jgi:hypothetical protein